jgi:hypothetical protein
MEFMSYVRDRLNHARHLSASWFRATETRSHSARIRRSASRALNAPARWASLLAASANRSRCGVVHCPTRGDHVIRQRI